MVEIAPDQGLFPNYTAGKYVENGSAMIVSRGLGNSIIPQRIFNRPEVVSVTLHANDQ
ncbi:phosphoesterase [Virgibacillus subterraneus]|uniref:phosphoesterase n=1 Tax=Virgibacillus subterraneus TaxID=621109 RepID=UPI001FE21C04|nr:phosphoesterase [Virgibacillus subterraneus]